MQLIGELAALATAALWSLTSIMFSEAGKRIGSYKVNKIRLVIAVGLYAIVLVATTGRILPPGLNTVQVFWLALSAIIGLVLGDMFLFKSFVIIGPRLTTLIFASSPIMTTIIAWFFLGEELGFWEILGIVTTLSGITWVVAERRARQNRTALIDHPDSGSFLKGVAWAFGGALGQALGLVLAKEGMFNAGGVVEPIDAAFVRMVSAVVVIWLFALVRGEIPGTIRSLRVPKAFLFCLGGSFVGPFLGVWMSLVAVSYIATGIAATLNAMVPVFVIPLVIVVYKEKVSLRAFFGALVAVAGVALIFLK